MPANEMKALTADHEVTLFFVDGSELRVSPRVAARNLLNRTGLKLVALTSVFSAFVAPDYLVEAVPLWNLLLVNLAKLSIFATVFLTSLALVPRFWPKGRRLPEILLSAFATGVLTLAEIGMYAVFDLLPADGRQWPEILLRNFVFFEFLTIMFFLFVHGPATALPIGVSEPPAAQTRGAGGRTAPDAPGRATITDTAILQIGTRTFDATEIRRISVEDHLLQLWLGDRTETVHGVLAEVAAQLGREAGVQLHRASWVAFRQIDRFELHDGRAVAVLKCGQVLPVARNRRKTVMAAFEAARASG